MVAVATTFFGFTDYGNQMLTTMTGRTVDIEGEAERLKGVANTYVRSIAPPPKTHGYSTYDAFLTFLVMYIVIAVSREVLNRIMAQVYRHREDRTKHTKWVTWNMVSMIFTTIVGSYGLLMTYNVHRVFWHEIQDIATTCGITGFFSGCPVRYVDQIISVQTPTPLTHQLIHGLDYDTHSSQIMFVSLLMIAYFVYDLTFNTPNREFIFHHLLALGCVSIYAWNETYAFYVATAMVTEISTVFLSAFAMIENKNWWKAAVMIEFAVTFFICRIVLITTVILMIWFNETGIRFWTALTSFVIFGVLNYYWFYLIVRKVIRVCKSAMKRQS